MNQTTKKVQMTFSKTLVGAIIIAAASGLAGCASTTSSDGVVKIGQDTYMIGGLGKFTDFSSSAVKGRLYKEASAYCEERKRVMSPLNSTGKDSGFGTYASAEIQFRCVLPDAQKSQ